MAKLLLLPTTQVVLQLTSQVVSISPLPHYHIKLYSIRAVGSRRNGADILG